MNSRVEGLIKKYTTGYANYLHIANEFVALEKENKILKLKNEKLLVDFSIPNNDCVYIEKIGGLTEHLAEHCNKCLLVKKSLELGAELEMLIE